MKELKVGKLSHNKIIPKKIEENIYEIPKGTRNYMKVPVRIFANEQIVQAMEQKNVYSSNTCSMAARDN